MSKRAPCFTEIANLPSASVTVPLVVPVSTTLKNGTLYVKATDKAGNVTNTTLTGINVDLGYPTLSITSPVGTPLVNGDSDLIVKVKAEDTFLNGATTEVASGIKSVKLKIGSQDFTTPDDSTEIATAGEPDIYTLTISGEMITDLGDSVIQSSVYIQAEDYTGKTQITSFALQIDKNPPTAVITSPYTASILNKEIQFTGRANDDQNLLIVNLYYTTAKVHPGVPNADPDTGNVWIKTAESTLDAEAEAAKNATGELRTSGQEVLKDIKKAQSRAADFMSRDAKIVSGDKIEKVINSKFNSLKKCNDPIRAKKLVNQIRRLAKRGNLEDSIQNLDSVYADVLKRLRNAHSTSGIAQVNARNALRGMIDGSETYQQMARTLKNRLTPLPPPPKPSWLSRVGQTIKGWLPKALKRTVR